LSPDPHAEKYANITPYSYCGGDPVNMADPSGMDIIETVIGVTFTGVDAQALFGYLSRTQPNSVHMSTSDGGGGVDGAGFSFALSFGFNGGINLGIANNAYMATFGQLKGYSAYGVKRGVGLTAILSGTGNFSDDQFFMLGPQPDGSDYLSSQLQPKIDRALNNERTRIINELNRPANAPFDSEDHYNPYIDQVDFTVPNIVPTTLYSYFPFIYTFGNVEVNGVFAPGKDNCVYSCNYSNPPVLGTNYFGLTGYFVSFETKGGFARATLIFKDLFTYNLFLTTKLGLK
jgi:hypothetical protein